MRVSSNHNQNGGALVIALVVILIVSALVGIAMQTTSNTARFTDSSRDLSALRAATEGALDFAYGVWSKTTNSNYRPMTTSELTNALAITPTFSGFPYASNGNNGPLKLTAIDSLGNPVSNPVGVSVNLDNYPGWRGTNYSYLASVRLTGTFSGGRQVSYGAKRTIEISIAPLFQATAFFEGDLELYKTAPMIIAGLIHTNSTAYVSGMTTTSMTITGNLSYVSGYQDSSAPPFADTWSGYTPNSALPPNYPNGASNQVQQVKRMEPLGTDTASVLDTTDANPNNDSMRELIEPPDPSYPDPSAISNRRFYNKAGIVIRTSGTTTTITTQNGTSLTAAQQTSLKAAITHQTFYDFREAKTMGVATLDVSQANSVLNAATGFNGVLYIDDPSSTGYSDPKAIRLKNGGVLPTNGLTVASQNPVYIQGDYNTGTTSAPTNVPTNATGNPSNTDSPTVSGYSRVSSAVIGDAVTILSNSWNDANSSSSLGSRTASNTTVNTAIVAGFVPSGWTNEYGAQYGYSGGLNNFPRFLETWSGKSFTYFGSMVQLFTSQIATGEWDTGNIYVPPTRCWNFDTNFTNNAPPGSLTAVALTRGPLVRF